MIDSFADASFKWRGPPGVVSEDGRVVIVPEAGRDFWRKTFYKPLLVKADATALVATMDTDITLEISLTLQHASQFDQAGAIVILDDATWAKAGIEVVDGTPRLSVVVTNDFSDWSTSPWDSNRVRLRLHRQQDALIVEAAHEDDWRQVRIANLRGGPWNMGSFAAAPTAQAGCRATFDHVRIAHLPSLHHSDLP